MNDVSRKIIATACLFASAFLVLCPSGVARSAVAPVVRVFEDITAEIRTPIRIATDPAGNFYVTDPKAGGVLKYDNSGVFVRKYATPSVVVGVAVASNGDLLVSQGTSVVVIDQATGNEKTHFGTFGAVGAIAVDSTGLIYVTDSRNNNIQKFAATYSLLATSNAALGLNRPTGIRYEKASNLIAVVNTSGGNIKFVNPSDLTLAATNSTLGLLGIGINKFAFPLGVAFEYDTNGVLYRIYVSDSYLGVVQVYDGASRSWLGSVGTYGFDAGKLITPRDIIFDQINQLNPRLLVINGNGNIAVFGCDNNYQ